VIPARQLIQAVFFAAAGVVYLGMGYLASISEHPPLVTIILGIIPLCAVSLASAWHSRARILSLLLFAACAASFVLNLENLRNHVAWLYFVQHAGAMVLLCFTFGITLKGRHADALCSRIAGFMQAVDAEYLHYTWKVTLAWTIYFAVSASASVLLFAFAPLEVWSVFANLLTPVLVGAMFVAEYLIRLKVMPGREHFSIAKTISAYREYSQRQHS
jgi:uncharacterized membrane protein